MDTTQAYMRAGWNDEDLNKMFRIILDQQRELCHKMQELKKLVEKQKNQHPVSETEFEISAKVLSLIGNDTFRGLSGEDPLEHLSHFEDLCGVVKPYGAGKDHFKAKVFFFSLTGNARRWYRTLQPDARTKWEVLKATFIDEYYTKDKMMHFGLIKCLEDHQRKRNWDEDTQEMKDQEGSTPRKPEPRSEELDESDMAAWPWPRDDATPFKEVPDPYSVTLAQLRQRPDYRHRAENDVWADWCSICYNGMLRMNIELTRVGLERPLELMGISEQVTEYLQTIGVGTICTKGYPVYPELVRQCLASAVVVYETPSRPVASEGRLTFFCRGRRFGISIPDLCRVFDFDPDVETSSFDERVCNQLAPVWYGIASGVFNSQEMKMSRIRNPVIRVVAKLLSLTFFAKAEAAAVRYDELFLLSLGLSDDVLQSFLGPGIRLGRVNLGAVFAERIASRRFRVLKKVKRTKQGMTEVIGSLLTPIFRACGIDLTAEPCGTGSSFVDYDYLERCHMYYHQGSSGGIYEFCLSGTTTYCRLPKQIWTAPVSLECVQFMLPLSETCTARGGDVTVLGLPGPEGHDGGAAHRRDPDEDHYHLPEYDDGFRPVTPPSDASSGERRAYEGLRANHERRKGFWNALRYLTRSCCRTSDVATPTPARAPPAAPAPDRAQTVRPGTSRAPPQHSSTYCSGDEDDDEDEEPLEMRRSRVRRRSERSSDDE